MYKYLIRPMLFCFKPERAHGISFFFLRMIQSFAFGIAITKKIFHKRQTPYELFGLKFPNRVGLAAGLDKEAEAYDILGALGFGFVEIGTITPKAQPGNPKPRLFRLVEDKALINRMGFNNKGAENAVRNLKRKRTDVIIGGNIGKNKSTANTQAADDYKTAFDALFDYVDYFAVNLSSPNTPNLRELQEKDSLQIILAELVKLNNSKENAKPVLLKIAPDLSTEQLDDILEIVEKTKIDGIIATNTTISREGISADESKLTKIGQGGLSGKPLSNKSTEIIRYLSKKSEAQIPIIASGGIMTAEDAAEKISAGANLVQIYTGFIYEGPALVRKINKKLNSQ